MRKSKAKRVVTIVLLILGILQFINVQPVFFGVYSYFGFTPVVFILPVSVITMVFIVLHVYQNWQLMLAWFKKSPDKKKQRDKMMRATVMIVFMLVISCSIAFGWYEALTTKGGPPQLETMRILFWVSYGLLVTHVWQRWRLTLSYFRRSPRSA